MSKRVADLAGRVARFRIWTERPVPEERALEWAELADFVGSAVDNPLDPFAALPSAEAVIAGARMQYEVSFMARAPHLRVISRTGAGYDNIDVETATARRIAVCTIPDGPTVSTAEHTVALILAVAKRLPEAQASLHSGKFDIFNQLQAVELQGRSLGLVGLGQIGGRVATAAQALGMRALAFDPYVDLAHASRLGATLVSSLDELLAMSDIVSLHAPLTASTAKIMDRDRIGRMRAGAILINTARGGLVDEAALIDALSSGHLSGAGLDVFDPEPPRPDNPLLHRIDVIATPHVAAATIAARERLWRVAIEQAIEVLRGDRPAHLVNPQVWDRPPDARPVEG